MPRPTEVIEKASNTCSHTPRTIAHPARLDPDQPLKVVAVELRVRRERCDWLRDGGLGCPHDGIKVSRWRTCDRSWVPPWTGRAYGQPGLSGLRCRLPGRSSPAIEVLDLGCAAATSPRSWPTWSGYDGAVGVVANVDARRAHLVARDNRNLRARSGAEPSDAFGPEHDATFTDLVLSRSVLRTGCRRLISRGVCRSAARLVRPGGPRIGCGGVGNVAPTVALLNDDLGGSAARPIPWTFADPAWRSTGPERAEISTWRGGANCFVRCVGNGGRSTKASHFLGWLHPAGPARLQRPGSTRLSTPPSGPR